MKPQLFAALVLFISQISCAHGRFSEGGLYDGSSSLKVEVSKVVESIEPNSVLIVSEVHDYQPHHDNQALILKLLRDTGLKVSVGMEFFDFTQQELIDRYLLGTLPEDDFLKQVKWGSIPFSMYREQVLLPLTSGGKTIGINAPRTLSSQVAKSGLESLSEELKKFLPPHFTLGRDEYRERFNETMSGHVPQEAMDRYFAAQSVWDDTMAHHAAEFLKRNPDQVLVILVGDFHAIYGGGLPDRLRARGISKLNVISQINPDQSESLDDEVMPHPKWGSRADYIWVAPR